MFQSRPKWWTNRCTKMYNDLNMMTTKHVLTIVITHLFCVGSVTLITQPHQMLNFNTLPIPEATMEGKPRKTEKKSTDSQSVRQHMDTFLQTGNGICLGKCKAGSKQL